MNDQTHGISEAAARILAAHKSGSPCPPIRDLLPKGDVAAAYAAQEKNTAAWLRQGRRLVGRKIGLTAKAVQHQLGVDQPDFGMLFADMAVDDAAEVGFARVLQPRVEAEIAFVLEREIAVPTPTAADVLRATAYVLPAIEIVGSRIAGWDIQIADTVADNASSGLFVLGGPARRLRDLDLPACGMIMERKGEPVSMGAGAACLGNPMSAVTWLARKMVEVGRPLGPGDIVLSGALGPMVSVKAGDAFTARVAGVGSVSVSFTDS